MKNHTFGILLAANNFGTRFTNVLVILLTAEDALQTWIELKDFVNLCIL